MSHARVMRKKAERSSLFVETAITGVVLIASVVMAEYLFASYMALAAVVAFFVVLVLKRGEFFVKYFAFVFAIGANILVALLSRRRKSACRSWILSVLSLVLCRFSFFLDGCSLSFSLSVIIGGESLSRRKGSRMCWG